MKKLTGIFLAMAIVISASSFTVKDDTVSTKVQSAFKSNFNVASDVSWKKLNGLYCAYFKVNDQNISATYNENGELVAASRTLNIDQLPLAVIVALKAKLPGYTIENKASEITADGQNSYFVKAENDNNITVLKITGNTTVNIESKTRKK
ncbi:MAG: hypothetical protein ABIR81_08305 [Ginsengibacter sp.]